MSLLAKIQLNRHAIEAKRAAARSVADGIGFTICSLAIAEIRRRQQGVPIADPENNPNGRLDTGYLAHDPENPAAGIDGFNESMKGRIVVPGTESFGNTRSPDGSVHPEAEIITGADYDESVREEQGFEVDIPPLILAARLKVVWDYIYLDLEKHAAIRVNPLDPKTRYLDPYHMPRPFQVELERQVRAPRVINEERIRAQAAAVGMPFSDALAVTKRQIESQHRFLVNNLGEAIAFTENLMAYNSNGDAYTPDDAEDVFDALPAINRVRLVVAADNGLWFYRQRVMGQLLNGRPGAAQEREIVAGERDDIALEYHRYMDDPVTFRAIDKALERGGRWPVLNPSEAEIDPNWNKLRLERVAALRAQRQAAQVRPTGVSPEKINELKSKLEA